MFIFIKQLNVYIDYKAHCCNNRICKHNRYSVLPSLLPRISIFKQRSNKKKLKLSLFMSALHITSSYSFMLCCHVICRSSQQQQHRKCVHSDLQSLHTRTAKTC